MVCCSCLTVAAGDNDLGKLLTSQYQDKILYLRHSFTSGSQDYYPDGQPVDPAGEGPWSLYGRMVVSKVVIDKNKLRIEGKRAEFRSDGRACGKGCMPYVEADPFQVTIRLHGPLSSANEADSALARVFAIAPEDVLKSVPSYWQEYLAKLIAPDAKKTDQAPDAATEKVFKMGEPGVTAPKATYQREPEFSELARKQRFQGTVGMNIVIDKTGRVSRVSIAKPLGLGLDEQSVNMVRTWKFTPATHDGEPVAIIVWIEVDFHLGPMYRR